MVERNINKKIYPQTSNTDLPIGLKQIDELLTDYGWKRTPTSTTSAGLTTQLQQQTQMQTQMQTHQQLKTNNISAAEIEYTYSKTIKPDDEVRIRLSNKEIVVAVPIANASYLFASKFRSYFLATEFVERHLETYEESIRNHLQINTSP